jgi:hypothetical protein
VRDVRRDGDRVLTDTSAYRNWRLREIVNRANIADAGLRPPQWHGLIFFADDPDPRRHLLT